MLPSDEMAKYHDVQQNLRDILHISNLEPIPVLTAGIFDAPTVYVCLNTEWASLIIQRVILLTDERCWQGTGAERAIAANEIKRLIAAMNCEDCSEFITDMRVGADGTLQKKVGGAWVNANGDGGDTTVVNNQNVLASDLYPPDPPDTGLTAEERACAIAENLIDWFLARFESALDAVDVTADAIAALDIFLAPTLVGYFIADAMTDALAEIVEATTTAIRATLTPGVRDNLICAVYCAIKDVGAINAGNWPTVEEEIEVALSGEPLLLPTLSGMIKFGITDAAAIHRAMLYQSSGSAINCNLLCLACGEAGCDTFAANDLNGWHIQTGVFVASGCTSSPGIANTGSGAFELRFTFADGVARNIVSIHARDTHDAGNIDVLWGIYNDGALIYTVNQFTGSAGAQGCFDAQFNSINQSGDEVRIYMSSDAYAEHSDIEICWS